MKQEEEMGREAVERYRRGGVSMRELARIYRVSASTVHRWIRGREAGAGSATGSSAGSGHGSGSAEVRRLRKELEEARLYNELLNAMIDIAEDRFEVPIRKKPGAQAVRKVVESGRGRSLGEACRLLGYTRQAYYKGKRRVEKRAFEAEIVLQEVGRLRKEQKRIGVRKLHHMMSGFAREHSVEIGRDALYDLLREHSMLVRKRRRRSPRTTFSGLWMKSFPNLAKGFEPTRCNQLWVSDITYIRVREGFAYLSLITDAYSRKIVGYCLSEDLTARGPAAALRMALRDNPEREGLIHHSDRGLQYYSSRYMKLIGKQIRVSMSEKSDPLENAIAERVNGILKQELLRTSFKASPRRPGRSIRRSIPTTT
ncbi:MAG: IS3 family transposase [Acidobacteria bacterium]|nr:IS3 family transposase [Acidobacteriota bacterium]